MPLSKIFTAFSLKALLLAAAVLLAFVPQTALAAGKLGAVIDSGRTNIMPVFTLMQYIAYVLGAFIIVRGLIKLKEHTEQGDRAPLSHAILHLLGGTFLVSLPAITGILTRTFLLNAVPGGTIRAAALAGGGPTLSLDVMLINFVRNIQLPMYMLLSALGVILGLFLIITGLLRLARNGGQDGPRNSFGSGTIMRLVIGSALLSLGATSDVFTNTLFGGSIVQFTGLDPSLGLGDTSRFDAALSAGLVFFQIIGFIAFMRGMLMLKALSEGGQVSTAAAFTHIFGGAMAFNIAPLLQVIQNTLGISISILNFA